VLTLEVIDNLLRLLEIKTEWSQFAENVPQTTPFQTPEWLLVWWRHFGSGELNVFVFRDEMEAIVGIVPCFLHDWRGRRQLTLIGSGISDYLEPLISPESRARVIDHLAHYLKNSEAWDICSWQDLSCGTPLVALGSIGELSVQAEPDMACSDIPLDKQFSEFWEERPRGLRRNVRRYTEKSKQIAPVEFVVNTYDEECYQALIRLHSARWGEQGKPGMILANHSAKFLHDIAKEFDRRQRLLFFTLHFQGATVATIMAFPYRNVLYGYLSAFDPAWTALGFGRTLLYESIQYAFQKRFASWNFLRGDEPYKSEWGARPIPKTRLIVRRGSIGRA
jgi:CelD/BcsL family acetyltransferase involved in cellulose biosynthesis